MILVYRDKEAPVLEVILDKAGRDKLVEKLSGLEIFDDVHFFTLEWGDGSLSSGDPESDENLEVLQQLSIRLLQSDWEEHNSDIPVNRD